MAVVKCCHCGRRLRLFGETWHHYWWVRDLSAPGERALRGTPVCAWEGFPAGELVFAEPLVGAAASV